MNETEKELRAENDNLWQEIAEMQVEIRKLDAQLAKTAPLQLTAGYGDLGIGALSRNRNDVADGVAICKLRERANIGKIADRGTFIDALGEMLFTVTFDNAASARIFADVFTSVAESLEQHEKEKEHE